jgi:hypothetical protein
MFKSLLVLSICFVIGFSESNYKVEDQIYSCLVAEYHKHGVDVEPLLDSLELYYISQGILKSNTGKSKFDFYKEISETGKAPTMKWHKLADSVGQIMYFDQQINQCLRENNIDSTDFNESKYLVLMKSFHTIQDVNLKNAAKAHIEVLTSKDFEHPYYRAHMIISFTRIYEREASFLRLIPND